MKTVLVNNPDRFGPEAAKLLRQAGTREGRYLRVPVAVYESVWKPPPAKLRPPEAIPDDYDPEKHRYVGRCCS
jgi:hypothetical protein